jgi:hypothetical protein
MKKLELVRGFAENLPQRFSACRGCREMLSGLEGHPHYGLCVDCQAIERRQRKQPVDRGEWLRGCGVPGRYLGPFEEEGLTTRALAALAWSAEPAPESGIVLFGPVGSGKSYLAAEVAWRLRRPGTRWIRSSDAVACEVGDDEAAKRVMHGAPVLVIDDLGKGSTGGAWAILGSIVCGRYEQPQLLTIVTTNLDSSAIPDPSLVDRLRDWKCLAITGPSRRGGG